MIETLCWLSGILGAFFFAINLLPQIIKCYRTKSCKDISRMFLVFAFCGNIFSAVFVLYTNMKTGLWQYPIYFNYATATILTAVLTIMKIRYEEGLTLGRKLCILYLVWRLRWSKPIGDMHEKAEEFP